MHLQVMHVKLHTSRVYSSTEFCTDRRPMRAAGRKKIRYQEFLIAIVTVGNETVVFLFAR